MRWGKRVSWWKHYAGEQFCIFGHYSMPRGQPHQWSKAICIDYGVSYRGSEQHSDVGLAVTQFPQKTLVFDDGRKESLNMDSG